MFAALIRCRIFLLLVSVTLSACAPDSSDTGTKDTNPPPPSVVADTGDSTTRQNKTNLDNNLPIQVLDISERAIDGKNGIAITFNTPVDTTKDIQSFFLITNKEGETVDGSWVVGKDTRQVWFMNTEPRQQYTITVNPGLQASNSSELLSGKNTTIATRNLQPSINFDSDGAVLPVGYTSGLPVVTVNIASVDVDFFKIREENIAEFLDYARDYSRSSWYSDNLKRYGDLAYSARFDLNPPKNTRVKRDLKIQQIESLQKPGLYFVVMREAGTYDDKTITWFSITDIGLHLRRYKNQLDVHTASLTSGKPLQNIELQLLDKKSTVLQSNRTTSKGSASFSGNINNAVTLVARSKNQYTVLDLRKPSLDLSEFDLGKRPQLPMELFIYAPRDLYRPGETAIFSGLLRDYDGKRSSAALFNATIRNPAGTAVKSFKWEPDDQRYYEYRWAIPANAPTGKWQLVVEGVLEKPASYSFNIEEFLPERLKLTLGDSRERTEITDPQQPAQLPILGEYLYGAPASGNRFSAIVQTQHWREPVAQLKGYQFGDINDSAYESYQELDEITLDKDGKTTLSIDPHWRNSHSPLKVTVIGSLYESGGRPVTRSHPLLIWPQQNLIGIHPQFANNNPEAGSQAKFDIVSADITGKLSAVSAVEVTLIREDRQYFWEYSSGEGWHWEYNEKEYPEVSETISLAADKPTTVSYPVDWGNYRLEVRNAETGSVSSLRFFAGYNWYYDWKNAGDAAAARPDKINLALDKPRYKAGDTAELKILPPSDGEALVLVESDRPLWSERLSVSKEGTTVNIPVSEQWDTHNIYVSALLIQPAGNTVKITPKRAMGVIHLPLDREARRLNFSIEAAEKIRPDSTLQVQLTLDEKTLADTRLAATIPAAPDKAATPPRVTLAAVDVGVLNISDFKTPDPFSYFFGQRRYTVDAKDIYADVIEAHSAEEASQRFGGDADLVRGGKKPQSEVQIVSLFQSPVDFDNEGKATVTLEIPDFNGRLRLMAVAHDQSRFGSSEQDVTVAAPIVAEIAMPRFLAMGDQSTLALDIQNLTETQQTLTVKLTTEAPLKLEYGEQESDSQQITLDPKQKTTLKVPVTAIHYEGLANIHASISGDGIDDFSRQWKLGVRPAYPALTSEQQIILKQGESFTLDAEQLPDTLPGTRQASISVSPAIDLAIGNQLQNLMRYPYGCLEQTSSRAWPLTFATPENQRRFKLPEITESERRKMIQKGIDRILTMQRSNGSFGLWGKESPEEHWLTVYATEFLIHARDMGMDVPEQPLANAIKRLSSYIGNKRLFVNQRWSSAPEHYAFATRAYAAYVLSELKLAPLGNLRNLYQNGFDKAETGLSQIQLGLALLTMGDKKNGEQALQKAMNRFPEEYHYWGDYGSRIRDLGMSVYLLLSHDQQIEKALQMALELRDELRNRRWLSTQERIALFMAGIELQTDLSQPWQASWALADEQPSVLSQTGQWSKQLDDKSIAQGLTLTSEHQGPIYLSAVMNGYGSEPPKAEDEGLHIERHWYNSKGKPVTPDSVNTGDLLLVHLAITGKQRVPDALVINLLPAGFELENQNLKHAVKMDDFVIDGKKVATLQQQTEVKHQEYRDDRFVAAIDHNGYAVSHLFFMVRAVTPGSYQVPPAMAEDMYRPEIRGVSDTLKQITVSE